MDQLLLIQLRDGDVFGIAIEAVKKEDAASGDSQGQDDECCFIARLQLSRMASLFHKTASGRDAPQTTTLLPTAVHRERR